MKSLAERFWEKVDKSGDCWLWTGARSSYGYGSIRINRKTVSAHRVAMQLSGVELGDKNALHHCDNPQCVNPAHLYAGTKSQNSKDAVVRRRLWQVQRTHCPSGHPYTPENTHVWGNGFRKCRTCMRDRARQSYRRKHNVKPEAYRGI